MLGGFEHRQALILALIQFGRQLALGSALGSAEPRLSRPPVVTESFDRADLVPRGFLSASAFLPHGGE